MTAFQFEDNISRRVKRGAPHSFLFRTRELPDGKIEEQLVTESQAYPVFEKGFFIKLLSGRQLRASNHCSRLFAINLSVTAQPTLLFFYEKQTQNIHFSFESKELVCTSNDVEMAHGFFALNGGDDKTVVVVTFSIWNENGERRSSFIANTRQRVIDYTCGVYRLLQEATL